MANRRDREPVLNAPWPAVAIALTIIALYFLQSRAGASDGLIIAYGLVPYVVEQGEFGGLFTSMFLHGGWPHALMNAAFALALGAPVARLLGGALRHAAAFFLFYILCGVLSNVIYVLLHPGADSILIGASGAVSGLMGASARLLGTRGALGPVLSRTVFSFAAAWIVVNLLLAFVGSAPGSGGMPIAWEAHLAGFFVGLLLIGPWAALFGRRSLGDARLELPAEDGPAGGVGPWGPAAASAPPEAPSPQEPESPQPPASPESGRDRTI